MLGGSNVTVTKSLALNRTRYAWVSDIEREYMKKIRMFGCFLCVVALACEAEEEALAGVDVADMWIADAEDPGAFGDAADDVPGCEIPLAFVANRNLWEDTPAWWAFDFSNCGPQPGPRLMVWESGDGVVCEQEFDPIGNTCEIIVMNDCLKVADDMWHATLWMMEGDSFSLGYEAIGGIDYEANSAIPCVAKPVGDDILWDCTPWPEQPPTCTPVTAG
jgi:hypothetical protein